MEKLFFFASPFPAPQHVAYSFATGIFFCHPTGNGRIWPQVRCDVIWHASGKLGTPVLYHGTWCVQPSTAKIFLANISLPPPALSPVPMFNSCLQCTRLMESKPGWSRVSECWWNFVSSRNHEARWERLERYWEERVGLEPNGPSWSFDCVPSYRVWHEIKHVISVMTNDRACHSHGFWEALWKENVSDRGKSLRICRLTCESFCFVSLITVDVPSQLTFTSLFLSLRHSDFLFSMQFPLHLPKLHKPLLWSTALSS